MAVDNIHVMNIPNRLIPNDKRLSKIKKRLLGSVIQSILLYGIPSWVSSLVNNARHTAILACVQRRVAIRCVAAYCSVSYNAITLVVCILSINFLVKEKLEAILA